MPEIISNTSPLQYLHQLDALRVFPQLVKTITIPPAVKQELEVGRFRLLVVMIVMSDRLAL